MKLRRTGGNVDKVEMQMTPMIDIVFQLLTFFLFSFKIAAPEGDFNINMPAAGTPAQNQLDDSLPIQIRLTANPDGTLGNILLRDRPLASFDELHSQIIGIVGDDRGPGSVAEKTEVELDCDYNLKYEHVIRAVTAVSGYLTDDGNVVKLIEKIKFSPPKKPSA
jgi:biopolymer transport protein ExbD